MGESERFMVVAFTEQWPEHTPMSEWPLHLTVLPCLRGDVVRSTEVISELAQRTHPLQVDIIGTEDFGENYDIRVWTVGPASVLRALHKTIYERLSSSHLAKLEDDTYTGDKYAPHISQKDGHSVLEIGGHLALPTLSVIAKRGGQKLILENIAFLAEADGVNS